MEVNKSMHKNREDYQAYQERWRKNHPTYFKEYYQSLKAGKHRAYKSLLKKVINLIENYKRKGNQK